MILSDKVPLRDARIVADEQPEEIVERILRRPAL